MNDLQSPARFLATRRSTPPALLGAPYPSREVLEKICESALRVPDHKMLEPWRLIALEGPALADLAAIVEKAAPRFVPEEKIEKISALYREAGCVIVLIFAPKEDEAVPKWEQRLSMGAVGVSLVNSAIAEGFGAYWATGFLPECDEVIAHLALAPGEEANGFIHIGTPASKPPERPRPDIREKISWL